MELTDFIVVGSSFCGVMSAKTLVDENVKVLMLDVGITQKENGFPKDSSFIQIRKTDEQQADFFLGKNFESLGSLNEKTPIHLTPNRKHTTKQVSEFLNWTMGEFNPIESLAKGGLGNAWGLGSYVYSDNELKETGLDVDGMKKAYQWVASHVSISGGNDASINYANGKLFNPQQAIPLDFNGQTLFNNVLNKHQALKKNGFTIGRAPLAVSTENANHGEKYLADDLDFYSADNSSAYRPNVTLNQLLKQPNFRYQNNTLVLKFKKIEDIIELECLDITTNETKIYKCKKLIMAAGTLGSARIIMRSLSIDKLPIISNTYSYMPSVQLKHIGAVNTSYQTGLAQLSLYYDKDNTHTKVAMGSLYSYRSLMMFRLLREFPMDYKNGISFFKLLQPALNITGIFHPEYGSTQKYIERVADTNSPTQDSMKSKYILSDIEELEVNNTEKAFKKTLFKIGAIPLGVKRNWHGASIHYGGTIPFSNQPTLGTINKNGQLYGFETIYIADGSGFNFLSGKGLTLTLMAYAHLTAKKALEK